MISIVEREHLSPFLSSRERTVVAISIVHVSKAISVNPAAPANNENIYAYIGDNNHKLQNQRNLTT